MARASSPGPEAGTPKPPPGARGTVFDRWVETSRWVQLRVLAYVAAAAATVFGIWKLLGQKESGFGPGDWQFWVAVTVALVPALATLAYVVPAWRARRRKRRLSDWSVKGDAGRPGHFRLGPYGEEDQGEFSRDDGAHAAALARVRGSTAPVFYFTGVSGSGKSSVLAAHVIPNLRADTLVVQ